MTVPVIPNYVNVVSVDGGSTMLTPEARRAIELHTRGLDDAALRRLVTLEASQYEPGALAIARDELRRRGIRELSPEAYWKEFPDEWLAGVGFCYRCWGDTTDESPGPTFTVFVGVRLFGSGDPCTVCGSVVRRMWFCIVVPIVALVLPIFPLDRYRVIRRERGHYIGRLLRAKAAA